MRIIGCFLILPLLFWIIAPLKAVQAADPNSPYGIGVDNWLRWGVQPQIEQPYIELARLLKESGAGGVLLWFKWDSIQPDGPNNWNEKEINHYQWLVKNLEAQGLPIVALVSRTPRWASPACQPNPPYNCSHENFFGWPPRLGQMSALNNYLEGLLTRLDDWGVTIEAWIIENELEYRDLNPGWPDALDRYPDYFNRARQVISAHPEVSPNPFFIVAGPTIGEGIYNWEEKARTLYQSLDKKTINAVSLHLYGMNDNFLVTRLSQFKTLMGQVGLGDKPLWITETNLDHLGQGANPSDSSARMVNRYRAFLNDGAAKVFWWSQSSGMWGPGILKNNLQGPPFFRINESVYHAFRQMTGSACQPDCPAGKPLRTLSNANCDDNINLIDFELWRQESTGIKTTKSADFNCDGTVNIIDFGIWRNNIQF